MYVSTPLCLLSTDDLVSQRLQLGGKDLSTFLRSSNRQFSDFPEQRHRFRFHDVLCVVTCFCGAAVD
jgi:hypothetical protein